MRQTKRMLTDDQWQRIAPHFPKHPPSPAGGRPRARDRDCLEGILWILRTGARWQDIPVDLPSGSTCWRRLQEWAGEEVLAVIHAILIEELDDAGKLDLSELLGDATFIRAKKGGGDVGKTKAGKGMKLEVVVDATGLPLGLKVAGANVSENELLLPALEDVPVDVTLPSAGCQCSADIARSQPGPRLAEARPVHGQRKDREIARTGARHTPIPIHRCPHHRA